MTSLFKDDLCMNCGSVAHKKKLSHEGSVILSCLTCGAYERRNIFTGAITQQLATRPKASRGGFRTYSYKRIKD